MLRSYEPGRVSCLESALAVFSNNTTIGLDAWHVVSIASWRLP